MDDRVKLPNSKIDYNVAQFGNFDYSTSVCSIDSHVLSMDTVERGNQTRNEAEMTIDVVECCLQQEDDLIYLWKRTKHNQTAYTASEPSEALPQRSFIYGTSPE